MLVRRVEELGPLIVKPCTSPSTQLERGIACIEFGLKVTMGLQQGLVARQRVAVFPGLIGFIGGLKFHLRLPMCPMYHRQGEEKQKGTKGLHDNVDSVVSAKAMSCAASASRSP